MADRQRNIDAFYREHGPCCAGCDWWRHMNSLVGECLQSKIVGGSERSAMIGMVSASLNPGAGQTTIASSHSAKSCTAAIARIGSLSLGGNKCFSFGAPVCGSVAVRADAMVAIYRGGSKIAEINREQGYLCGRRYRRVKQLKLFARQKASVGRM